MLLIIVMVATSIAIARLAEARSAPKPVSTTSIGESTQTPRAPPKSARHGVHARGKPPSAAPVVDRHNQAAAVEPQPARAAIQPCQGQARANKRTVAASVRVPKTAAEIRLLISRNAKNTEIVSFADEGQHPVNVVRGKPPAANGASAKGVDEIVGFTGEQAATVRVLRGRPPVAAVAPAMPAVSRRQSSKPSVQIVSFASLAGGSVTVLRGWVLGGPADLDAPTVAGGPEYDLFHAPRGAELDRVAFAVDGAESAHGSDPRMWRPELTGPQGPMQVSAAAAVDSGGGDRFDLIENRRLGRAYLARLYRRYGNWPDAVAAYNWGPGNLGAWIGQGRPAAGFPLEVERYRERVLRDGGIRQDLGAPLSRTGWLLPTP